MSRNFIIPFLTAGFLVAPAVLPSVLVSAMGPGLSGTAQAAKNLNSSRSNIYRTAKTRSPVTTPKAGGDVDRMGGGGGPSMGGGGANMGGGNVNRMGGGGGASTK